MALLEFRESSGAGSARGGSQGRGGGVGHHGKMRLRLTWEMDIPMCHSQTIRWIRAGIDLKWLVDWNTGFFKKKSQPSTGKKTEIPCLPPQPPTSMLWSEVPSCFFWRPPNTKFRRQHWIGGRGDMTSVWPLWCGTVLHGMAVFFEELGMFGWDWQMLGWIYQAFQTVAFEKSHPLCLAINWILSTMGSTLIPMCNYPHSGMSSNQCFQVQAPKDDPLLKLLSSQTLIFNLSHPRLLCPLGRAAPADAACAEEAGGEDRGARCRAGGNQGAERIILQQWQCWLEELGL